ncbi:MAG: SDR family oxidoreductase [Hyphomicrobiales bacterium]|nr:SDR family oxidoreductase [Hyphomicrobiales bacterium]
MSQALELAGKVALVTGGSRGIGQAIVEALAARGADIALHCTRGRTDVAELAASVAKKNGVSVEVLECDFRESTAIDGLFSRFDSVFERLDIVVNNAGYETASGLEEMPLAVWEETLRINLTAPFLIAQAGVARMKPRGGVVINVSSIHDDIVRKGGSHYGVAKAGLKMFGRGAALEWAEHGVRVVTVSPGAIETDMNRQIIHELGPEKFGEWIPAGRVGQVEEVASVVAFLASDGASYITGTEIYVDGGYMRNLVRYDDRPAHSGR